MKITWLNSDCTEAIVTRGFWWWKRQAHIERRPGWTYWQFVASKRAAGSWTSWRLGRARDRVARQRDDAKYAGSEWTPVAALPPARLVERKP